MKRLRPPQPPASTSGSPFRVTRSSLGFDNTHNIVNRMRTLPPPSMSFKELVKAVGIDPESGPTSWRKAISHSAETVVFYQLDLEESLPRMHKSVCIRPEHGTGENIGYRLIPAVFIQECPLPSAHIRTALGRTYLADEDDLMKLLEYVGVLQVEKTIDHHEMDSRNDEPIEEISERGVKRPRLLDRKSVATRMKTRRNVTPYPPVQLSDAHYTFTGEDCSEASSLATPVPAELDDEYPLVNDGDDPHLSLDERNEADSEPPSESDEPALPLSNESNEVDGQGTGESTDNSDEENRSTARQRKRHLRDRIHNKIKTCYSAAEETIPLPFFYQHVPGGFDAKVHQRIVPQSGIVLDRLVKANLEYDDTLDTPEKFYKRLMWKELLNEDNMKIISGNRREWQGFAHIFKNEYHHIWAYVRSVRALFLERNPDLPEWQNIPPNLGKRLSRREQRYFHGKLVKVEGRKWERPRKKKLIF